MPPSPDRKTPRSTTESSQKNQSKGAGKEKVQTLMDKWVEPPVAAAAPSYADHGGHGYGVLDGMQALGDLPSAKVKGRVKGEGARKSVLGRASAVDALDSPHGSPAPQPPTPQPADLPAPHTLVIDDEKDDDYAPKVTSKKRDRTTRNRGARRVGNPSSSLTPVPTPLPPAAPAVVATPTPTPAPAPVMSLPASAIQLPVLPAVPAEYGGDKLKRVVEAAKARAIEVGKPDLAAAVNEIYEQSQTDHKLRILLQAILSQNATNDQNVQFQDYVRAAKKKLKDAKQRERQLPVSSKATDSQPSPIAKAQPTTLSLQSAPLLQAPSTSQALPSTEPAEPPKGKISLKVKSPAKSQHRRKPGKSTMSLSPKKRSGSVGSDSSLTDLTSNDEDDGMELDDDDDLHQGPPLPSTVARVNGVNRRDQAAERGSLTVPSGGTKRSSVEAELEQERDRILAAKKQKFGESVHRDYDWQESSLRPAVQAPKSRTEKVRQEALAPKLTLQANGSRAGSVRPSRAVSMDIDSPLSSPAASRQSTPKVLKPAPKAFIKRAKTKQS